MLPRMVNENIVLLLHYFCKDLKSIWYDSSSWVSSHVIHKMLQHVLQYLDNSSAPKVSTFQHFSILFRMLQISYTVRKYRCNSYIKFISIQWVCSARDQIAFTCIEFNVCNPHFILHCYILCYILFRVVLLISMLRMFCTATQKRHAQKIILMSKMQVYLDTLSSHGSNIFGLTIFFHISQVTNSSLLPIFILIDWVSLLTLRIVVCNACWLGRFRNFFVNLFQCRPE